jgi:hypothetical protein
LCFMTAILIGGGGAGKEYICQGTVKKEAVHELERLNRRQAH